MDEILNTLGFNTQLVLDSPLFRTPWPHYLIHYFLLTIIVWGPPFRAFREVMIIPMILHLFKSPFYIVYVADNASALCKVLHGMVIGHLFNATLALLGGTPVEYTDYRIDYGLDLDRLSVFSWRKFNWAFARCFINMRGIGWNWQYKYVGKRPNVNKWWFIIVKCQMFETYIKYIGYDICVSIQKYLNEEKTRYLNSWPLVWLFIDSLTFTYIIYYGLNACYFQIASLSLILGLSQVNQWPDMFQIFHKGVSLRSFWTIWWHQYLTMDAIKISGWIVNSRGVLQVITIFTITGLIHVYGTICANSKDISLPWRSLVYFMLSGVNLLVERKIWKWRFFPILVQIYLTCLYSFEFKAAGVHFPIYNKYISIEYVLNKIW